MIGKFFGPRLFSRPNSKLFKQENLEKAHEFMEKYGPKAIVLARFVPIVRTFAPIVAGAGRMKYRTFLTYNVIGGVAWGTGVTLAGYWLGQISLIKNNVEAILVLIVFVSVVPILIEYLRERGKKKRAAAEAPAAATHAQPPVMDDATTQLRRIPRPPRPSSPARSTTATRAATRSSSRTAAATATRSSSRTGSRTGTTRATTSSGTTSSGTTSSTTRGSRTTAAVTEHPGRAASGPARARSLASASPPAASPRSRSAGTAGRSPNRGSPRSRWPSPAPPPW